MDCYHLISVFLFSFLLGLPSTPLHSRITKTMEISAFKKRCMIKDPLQRKKNGKNSVREDHATSYVRPIATRNVRYKLSYAMIDPKKLCTA